MLQEKGVVFQKPRSSKDLYYVRDWTVVVNKFSGMTFIISKNSKNIVEIVEMFQKEKLDIQTLSVYWKVFSAAYFTAGCIPVSPTELFQSVCVHWASQLFWSSWAHWNLGPGTVLLIKAASSLLFC